MAYTLSSQELQAVENLPAEQRYQYLITQILETGQVWSLHSPEGWAVVSSEGDECLPIWPHPDFAALWATDDWADCKPKAIDLITWTSRWLPGMEADGTMLAVFPNRNEEGVVISPAEMAVDLENAGENAG